jgi:hypothetical protein
LSLLSLAIAIPIVLPVLSFAHTRGNHAGDWSSGQTVKICVCPFPGADVSGAIEGALATWNDAKTFAGAITLSWHLSLLSCDNPPAECDVTLDWSPGGSWGRVGPGTMPVPVNAESNDGLDARGVQRVLMHEFGHVKGLGHSGLSDIMEWNFRGTGGASPTAGELNGADAFETPNADDLALNKDLHGTAPARSSSSTQGSAIPQGSFWRFDYILQAQAGPGLNEPVTRFTLELPLNLPGPSGANPIQMPPGWQAAFMLGEAQNLIVGKPLDLEEAPQRPLLTFWTDSPGMGVPPGGMAFFAVMSPFGPRAGRGFTNSPSLDTDESPLPVPGPAPAVPSLTALGFALAAGLIVLVTALGGRRLLLRSTGPSQA